MEQQQLDMIVGSVFDTASTTQKNQVGRCVRFDDARAFRYSRTDSDITMGDLVISTVNEADIAATYFGADTATAPVVGKGGAIGDTTLALCDLTSSIAVNEFQQGYLTITDGTGEAYMYKIKSNEVGVTSGEHDVVIYDGLVVALDNTSVGTMIASPWWDVTTHTAGNYGGTATQICVGKVMAASTAGTDVNTQYIWVQTWGPALVQAGTATGVRGGPCQLAEDDNGSGQIRVVNENRVAHIGVWMEATADGIYGPVFLQICP